MAYPTAAVTSSGVSWSVFQQDGIQGLLEALITANTSATAVPTSAATASATGGGSSGGLLASGTYYFIFTETNAWGETTKSPEGSQLTVAAGNQPQFTFPSLKTGNVARNLYLGAKNGSSGGPYFLYAAGITTTTYTAATAVPTNSYAVNPPTINTTGLTFTDAAGNTINKPLELIRDLEKSAGNMVFNYLKSIITDFLGGQPQGGNAVPFGTVMMKLNHVRGTYALLLQAIQEMGTLIDANPGSLTNSSPVGNLYPVPRRTWP